MYKGLLFRAMLPAHSHPAGLIFNIICWLIQLIVAKLPSLTLTTAAWWRPGPMVWSWFSNSFILVPRAANWINFLSIVIIKGGGGLAKL